MKKNVLILLIAAMGLFTSVSPVYASEVESVDTYEYEITDDTDVSLEEIGEIVEETIEEKVDESVQVGDDEAVFDAADVDLSGAYYEYSLIAHPVSTFAEDGSFLDLISDDYLIKVPYVTEAGENAIMVYAEIDGELTLVEEKILGIDEVGFVHTDKVTEIIREDIPGTIVEDVKYTYSNKYYMTIIYVRTDKGEYLIPYAKKGEVKLTNGKAYTVDKFFKVMNKTFDEDQTIDSEENGGGLPYRKNNVVIYMVSALVSLVLMGACLVGLKKAK